MRMYVKLLSAVLPCLPAGALSMAGALSASAAAPAEAGPSFNCRSATNATETAICAGPVLERQDRQLARLWKSTLQAFNDTNQIARMKLDQKHWLAERNACAMDATCISGAYRSRSNHLGGADPAYPAAGLFTAKGVGAVALYPLDGAYLVSIQTSEPKSGAWTCEVTGEAKPDRARLTVTTGTVSFPMILRNGRTLSIEPDEQVTAIARSACGLNGSFAFTYTRRSPPSED